MDTKILNKISKVVQFRTKVLESGKKEYIVERKSEEHGEWEVIARSVRIERSLMKKHNAWLAQLSRMNYTHLLLNRRKNGKGTFIQLLLKKKRK